MRKNNCLTRRQTLTAVAAGASVSVAGCNGSSSDHTDGIAFDHPDTVLADEVFDITVEGLPSNERVDVVLTSEDGDGESFEGRATVETGDGTVSLADATVVSESDDPLDGVVDAGVDVPLPLALFQFAAPLQLRTYSAPDEHEFTYRIERDGETVGTTALTRTYPDFDRQVEPDHPGLEGALYEPADGGAGPGVVVLHGSDGDPSLPPAARLAARGYTALALQYFGGEGLPDGLNEIPLEYVRDAATWLRDRESTTGERVGLFGTSRGGELALLAGSQFDAFGPVVSVNGSGLVWEGANPNLTVWSGTSTWTLDGEPVPYVDGEHWYDGPDGAAEEEVEAASIPVEDIDGPVVLVSGGADELWPSAELQGPAADRLDEYGHPNYEHLVYEDAGHFIPPRYTPTVGLIGEGGTYEGAAEASHGHWGAVLDAFLSLRDR
jgi:nucleolar protein 56